MRTIRDLSLAALALAVGACTAAAALDPPELDLSYGVGATKTLTVRGVEIGYLDKGEGPAVVFYHPSADLRYWQWVIEAVAPGRRAIALPFESVVPDPGPSDFAALAAVIEDLDAAPAHLVAHSWGAHQALELAIARPDLLASLTVVEPSLAPEQDAFVRMHAALAEIDAECPFPDLSGPETMGCLLQARFNEPGFYENAPDSLLHLMRESESVARVRAAAPAEPPADGPPPLPQVRPICDDLGEIETPVLFIRGALTSAPVQASLDAYEACLPEHESATIPDSAHYPFVYNPDAFNEILLEFLRGL